MTSKLSRTLLSFLIAALAPGVAPYQLFAQQVLQSGINGQQQVRIAPVGPGTNPSGGSLDFSLKLSPSMTSALPGANTAPKVDPRQMAIPWVDVAAEMSQPVGLTAPVFEEKKDARPQVAAKASLAAAGTILAAEGPKQEKQEGTGFKARWDRFWTGSKKAKTASEPSVQGAESAETSHLAAYQAKKGLAKKATIPAPAAIVGAVALGAVVAAPHVPGPIGHFLTQIKPYSEAGAILAGTFMANKAVGWVIKKVAERHGWDPNTTVIVRLVAAGVTWAAGIATGLHMAGVSTHTLLTGAGVGGIAISMAAKDFMGNLLEGVKVLLLQPFLIGEKVKIGDTTYTVHDMSLRYVDFKKDDGSITKMLYTQLSEKPITIFREYSSRFDRKVTFRRLPLLQELNLFKQATKANLGKSTLWLALGLALIPALPWLQGALGLGALAGYFPYIKGGMVLLTTRAVENWISDIVSLFAEKSQMSRQSAVVAKLLLQVAAYSIGGGIALSLFGVSGTALLASYGATSLVVGWAASDMLSNIIQGLWILVNRPFRIGDTIEIGKDKGVVMDMSLNYLVLKMADNSYTLIPYSLLKTASLTVFPPEAAK